MVRFARQASAAEITNFLQNYQAALVDGPTPGGLYRVRIAMTSLAKEELARYGVQPDWFQLGDRDLATHLVRSSM